MIDRAIAFGTRIVTGVDGWLQRHRLTRVARTSVIGLLDHDGLNYAGSMAYFSILSFVNVLLLGAVLLAALIGEGEARAFILDWFAQNTPVNPTLIAQMIDAAISSRGSITIIGIVFLLWGALGFFGAVSRGINRAFSDGRPLFILREKLLGILLILFSGGLILASAAIGFVTSYIQNNTREIVDRIQGGDVAMAVIGSVIPFLLVFIAYLVLYRVVPSQKVTLGDVWPGALVAAVLWTLLRVGYTIYVTEFAHFEDLFGPLAAIITLIVFIYFASVVLLIGAEVARANLIEAGRHRQA
ncbi:MAG TPA: YihY/virulence factor BrkB family protein [Candidatus Limnocylindria bacterium]|nr:YihY/virulence factor BrkB family protein [Candidatus Limnocylindria bacterium]